MSVGVYIKRPSRQPKNERSWILEVFKLYDENVVLLKKDGHNDL